MGLCQVEHEHEHADIDLALLDVGAAACIDVEPLVSE
jgi:hypothetical protein